LKSSGVLHIQVMEEILQQIRHQRNPARWLWLCFWAQLAFTYLSKIASHIHWPMQLLLCPA